MKTKIEQFRNNCTLVAVREVTGAEDETIIDRFVARGWRKGHGATASTYLQVVKDLGFTTRGVSITTEGRSAPSWTERPSSNHKLTLGMFRQVYPHGAFLVRVNGHLLVIRDGRVIDPNFKKNALRRRVQNAWEVENPAPSRSQPVVTRLVRNADPLVYFRGGIDRRTMTAGFERECDARMYVSRRHSHYTISTPKCAVRVSDITSNTSYTRADAAYDIKRGHLVVVPG